MGRLSAIATDGFLHGGSPFAFVTDGYMLARHLPATRLSAEGHAERLVVRAVEGFRRGITVVAAVRHADGRTGDTTDRY
jgi:hypothetical protein